MAIKGGKEININRKEMVIFVSSASARNVC
jgi:hypothetical protein